LRQVTLNDLAHAIDLGLDYRQAPARALGHRLLSKQLSIASTEFKGSTQVVGNRAGHAAERGQSLDSSEFKLKAQKLGLDFFALDDLGAQRVVARASSAVLAWTRSSSSACALSSSSSARFLADVK